jgi:threonyl-tRNA synthetase
LFKLKPRPDFIEHRLKIWNELMDKYKVDLATKETRQIKVTLPDGRVMEGESWRTTPLQIAEKIRFISFLNSAN